ncbi:hypothetical protein Pan216_32090 [Planctomycetes bacterium Pan216]|uniref:HEAT repeat protein n=1 Tax=Kolteria novifilia TaxID=2527975 RepID=A0A518B5Y8_9BACT|nr:hypothetical protein Pan216_32090 [Planctomycetes bacterium Pan216]
MSDDQRVPVGAFRSVETVKVSRPATLAVHVKNTGITVTIGIEKTLDILSKSENLAAGEVLLEASLSGPPMIREAAFDRLLRQRRRELYLPLVKRWPHLTPMQQQRLLNEGEALSRALREAFLSNQDETYAIAIDLIRRVPAYDLAPLLVSSLLAHSKRQSDAVEILSEHAQRIARELSLEPAEQTHQDIERVRLHFLEALRQGLPRYANFSRAEILRAYLLLAEDDDEQVPTIIDDHSHPAHRDMIDTLCHASVQGIMRWVGIMLFRYPNPHAALKTVFSKRDDLPFVREILKQFRDLGGSPAMPSMRELGHIPWLSVNHPIIGEVEDEHQTPLVRFAMTTGIDQEKKLDLCAHFLEEGTSEARLASIESLAQLAGPKADSLVIGCLEDDAIDIQLAAVVQLRDRGAPNALEYLFARLEHADERIREAARNCLADFRIEHYLNAFERLDDKTRLAAGRMMLGSDQEALESLRGELRSPYGQHRKRALKVVGQLGLYDETYDIIFEMLNDGELVTQREAKNLLAESDDPKMVERMTTIFDEGTEVAQIAAKDVLLRLARESDHPDVRDAAQRVVRELELS